MNSPSIWTAEWNPQEQHLARQLESTLRVSSLDSCPEEMETVQEGTKATRNRKPESLKEERQSWARERQGQATKSWGRSKVLVSLQIVLAWLFHKIEFSCQKWIYFLFFFLFFKIVLNLFQQAVWVIPFCYKLMKIHQQPMTDPCLSLTPV